MRAIWTGSLSFGLINIPVKLYSATQENSLSFTMLHKKDLSPIRYAKVCRSDGKEIPYSDIVKGYEYQKGDYVILTDEDFKRANIKKTKTIEMVAFTDEKEIDTIFYEKPYYLEPDKGAEKAYVLLRAALAKSKKIGLAKFVLHNREHIAVIKPYDNLLVLNQLRYLDEIRQIEDLHIPDNEDTSSREISMAIKLIDHLSSHFDADEFHDTYKEELLTIIDEKAKGKKPKVKSQAPKKGQIKDIMSLLKESLENHHKKIA